MTVFFPDVAHYEAGLSLRGAPFAVAKATQGTTYVDPTYLGFKGQAAQLGVGFAAYHWPDTGDLQAQAEHAYLVIGDVPTMWDAEANGATVPRLVELTTRYRALGGNPRAVYLPHWWWQSIGSPSLVPLADEGLFLVSSNYPVAGYTETGPGWAPYGGMTPAVWQYTDKQNFNGQAVDFNAFKGTQAELLALWGLAPTAPVFQEDQMLIATDGHNYYLCDGMRSRLINPTNISDLVYLSRQGLMNLGHGTATNTTEWTQGGLVRLGWNPDDYGPVDQVPAPGGPVGPLTVSLTGTATPAA